MAATLWRHLVEFGAVDCVWSAVRWGLAGLVAGLVFGLAAFFLLRALGAYRLDWQPAKWLRVIVCLLGVLAAMGSLGLIGAAEGVWRSLRQTVERSPALPKAAEAGTLLLAQLYVTGTTNSVSGFADGQWEINVTELQRRLDTISEATVKSVTQSMLDDAAQRWPALGGRGQPVLGWIVGELAQGIVRRKLRENLDRFGIATYWDNVLRSLPAAAARTGDPQTISREELSGLLAQHGLAPLLTGSLRSLVRSFQVQTAIVLALALVLPVAAFRIPDVILRRRQAKATP